MRKKKQLESTRKAREPKKRSQIGYFDYFPGKQTEKERKKEWEKNIKMEKKRIFEEKNG